MGVERDFLTDRAYSILEISRWNQNNDGKFKETGNRTKHRHQNIGALHHFEESSYVRSDEKHINIIKEPAHRNNKMK